MRSSKRPIATADRSRFESIRSTLLRVGDGHAHKRLARAMASLQAALVVLLTCQTIRAEAIAVSDEAKDPKRENSDANRDANALFVEAQNKIAVHDLSGALVLLKQCYELTGSNNLLYNMARLQQELQNCSDALANYRLFVQGASESPWRDDANQQIATLESTCAQSHPTQVVPEPTPIDRSVRPPASEPSPHWPTALPEPKAPWSTIGWVALGTGTLTSVATVYFAKQALAAKRHTDTPNGNADAYYAQAEDLTRNSTYAWTFGAVSAVALGVGVYALVVGARKGRISSPPLAAIVLPKASAIAYSTAF